MEISAPGAFVFIGLLFFLAFWVKAVARKLKVPEVTGFVILGVLLGGSLLGILGPTRLDELQPLSTVALGIIAFMIGVELKIDVIRRLGRPILFIVIFESLGAFALVLITQMIFFPGRTNEALLLGAVASATAPAATVAVIHQYKAKGPLTTTVLAVVGMDDAVALIIYVFASSIVRSSLSGEDVNVLMILGSSLLSIFLSLGMGAAFAFLFVVMARKLRESDWISLAVTAFVLGIIGLAEWLGVSELLAIMVFGALCANFSPLLTRRTEGIIEYFAPVFLAAFFVLGGAHLDVRLLGVIGLTGIVYFFGRAAGKIGGASLGALLGKAPGKIRKYVGFALLPQVGVALALALAVNQQFNIPRFGRSGHDLAVLIINVLLFTTIITEVAGPIMTRTVLGAAGEIPERESPHGASARETAAHGKESAPKKPGFIFGRTRGNREPTVAGRTRDSHSARPENSDASLPEAATGAESAPPAGEQRQRTGPSPGTQES